MYNVATFTPNKVFLGCPDHKDGKSSNGFVIPEFNGQSDTFIRLRKVNRIRYGSKR